MALPPWFGNHLPCGCVRGVKLCAEAEALWDDVADAHNVLAATWRENIPQWGAYEPRLLAARKGYDAAMDAFMSHVEVAGEASAVQGAML